MSDDETEAESTVSSEETQKKKPSGFVLDYSSPQAAQRAPRAGSVAKGMAAVWASVIAAVLMASMIRSNGLRAFAMTLLAGTIASAVYGGHDASRKHHGAFFTGMLLGVVTVIGVGALTIAVVCGFIK